MADQFGIKDFVTDVGKLIFDFPYYAFIFIRAVIDSFVRQFWPRRKKLLDGEVILITGAASGIGRTVALKLAKLVNHATFVLWDINEHGLLQTAEECRSEGCRAYPYVVDLSSRQDVMKTAEQVKSDVGVVTILFNNAGISPYSSFLETNPVLEEKVIQVNLMSYMWTIRAFLPGMIERGNGHLVQTCSGLGFWRFESLTAYCTSKYGLRGFIRSLQLEMRRHPKQPNIKFTTIFPGWVKTPMTDVVSWEPRYKTMMALLEPDYVCDKIIAGIQTESEEIMVPGYLRFVDKFNGFLPTRFADELEAFTMRNLTHKKNVIPASNDIHKLPVNLQTNQVAQRASVAYVEDGEMVVVNQYTPLSRVTRSRGNVYRRRNQNRIRNRHPAAERRVDNYGGSASGPGSTRYSDEDSKGYASILG
ncbi:Estradiol 17-beta-dehydrogenase 11 [Orchesella cincta]|uniref:Short-chain dehydrogenase/reductase 3 n=1 Tax=Orchesella cincta TaxID=48709 RepID=A0A1D2N683_ORCCI|nr:Estradiol 17-beta-dehydrogenase 11 [Orchesella cincta]